MMVGFGAGLSWGVTVMQMSNNALTLVHEAKDSTTLVSPIIKNALDEKSQKGAKESLTAQ